MRPRTRTSARSSALTGARPDAQTGRGGSRREHIQTTEGTAGKKDVDGGERPDVTRTQLLTRAIASAHSEEQIS